MGLTKSGYILKQLNKSKNKMYEAYVTHRIFNALKSYDLRFSCQQYVKFENGNYALLDMYFPDLNVQVEIDEGHHNNKENIKLDGERQRSVEETIKNMNSLIRNGVLTLKNDLEIFRVKIFDESKLKSIEKIDIDIDDVIIKIKKKIDMVNPEPWDFDEDFSYKKYLKNKTIDVSDNIQLKYVHDVVNLFGGNKDGTFCKGKQTAYGELLHLDDKEIFFWCPKNKDKDWNNELENNGRIIREKKHRDHGQAKTRRATFFKAKDNLGNNFYRFVGVFEGIESNDDDYNMYKKISDWIKVLPVQDN